MVEKGLKAGQTRKGKIPLVEQFGFFKKNWLKKSLPLWTAERNEE